MLKPIEPNTEAKPKARVKIDYDACIEYLNKYGGFFLADIDRRTAWYAKRVLSNRLNRKVEAAPFIIKTAQGYEEGYLFGYVDDNKENIT
jgi:hypothetical protein